MTIKIINTVLISLIIILSLFVSSYGFFSKEIVYENKTFQTINGQEVTIYGKGLYFNDSVSCASQARAQDIVTLVVGIPLLLVSLILANKNSIKGKLLLTGTLGYFLYTYTSYSFLAMYNKFFLAYAAIMSLSLFSFILNITANKLKQLENHFSHKFPKKYIGIFNIFTGIGICLLWLGTIIPSFGNVPAELEHYTTLVIQAMDLGFIVPTAVLSGVLLLKNRPLGYLLTSVIIIKGVTMLLAVVMMLIFMLFSGVNVPIIQMVMFPFLSIVFVVNMCILLKNVNSNSDI